MLAVVTQVPATAAGEPSAVGIDRGLFSLGSGILTTPILVLCIGVILLL